MDLLSKEEPLINLNGFDSTEEGDDLLSEDFQPHHQRRLSSSKHVSLNNRQHRLPSGSKVYLRELSPVRKEPSMERHNSAIVSAVERTMKNYADGVLRVLEGMSGRLSQLEAISQDLEHSVTTLRSSVEEYHEHTDHNFKILNERIMEMHRSVQILRDKQDITEAHAQLEKLQTSKALAEKEAAPGLATTDSQETEKGYPQQEQALQVQSQKPSPQPLSLAPLSLVSQPQSLAPQSHMSQPQPQSIMSQPQSLAPQSVAVQQYQVPNVHPQQLVPVQHAPQDTSGQVMQQISKTQTPSEQVQYQAVPQQLQVQSMLPTPSPMLQTQQPSEQGRYVPMPSQIQMQQPPLQQGSSQVMAPQQTEQAQYQPAPQQRQMQVPPPQAPVQQPIQAQQGMVPLQAQQTMVQQPQIQAHQGVVPQHSPHLQQQSGSRFQGSFQYYGQSNDGQSYASLAPTYAQGAYVTEPARDSANYSSQQRPLPPNPTHQSSPLPPIQSFHQMASTPPQVHESSPVGNVSGPMTWNRQTNLGTPSAGPRLPTAHHVRADHPPPPEVSGIVEKVVAMGFSRDQVLGVIRRLAERNQSVDMNMVLDILMNGGRGVHGGFGR